MKKTVCNRRGTLFLGTAIALTLAIQAPAIAQEEPDADADEREVIIVTAAKREQSLQDTPMAVTAFTSEDLERMGAEEFIDYSTKVPNLGFGADADGRFDSRKIGIRGVFGAGQATTGGTTGFYIDEMPVPETMNPRIADVTRIEVLRGPQGTLYGARSMGGTVRIISAQPDLDEFIGKAHSSLSTVREGGLNWQADASLNFPLVTDKAAVRISGYFGENSGVQDRAVLDGSPGPDFFEENVDDEQYLGGQIAALFDLGGGLSFNPRVIYQKIDAGGLPFADTGPGNFTQARNFNLSEAGSDEFVIASATFNWDLNAGSIVSSTGYMKRSLFENEDMTLLITYFFGTPPIPSTIAQDLDFEAFVHETRFTSDFDGPFQINVGGFYQETDQRVIFPPALAVGLDEAFTGPSYPPGILGTDLIYETDNNFDTKELAGFFELSYDLTGNIRATVGGRLSRSQTDYFVTADGLANGGPSEIAGKQSETSFNPKFLLEADLSEDVMLYATAAKGFRIGGVNGNVPPTLCADDLMRLGNPDPDSLRTYDSDSLWNYEIGVKSSFADRRVTLNGALFYIDWDDVIQSVRLSCGFQYFANAGHAVNKGFELEMMAYPTDALMLSFGAGFTDATFKDVTNPSAAIEEGDRVQQIPRWTLTAASEYSFPIWASNEAFVRGDISYQSDSLSANNDPVNPRIRPAWTLINARAGIDFDSWEIAAFVDNVTNELINLADNKSLAAEHPDRPRIVTNRPRTIGVEARIRF